MARVRVGVLNVTGYAGGELARLLARHPGVELVEVTGRSSAGEPLARSFAHLEPLGMTILESVSEAEVCFSALPHHASAELVPSLLAEGKRVVDISADYRLQDQEVYETWYGPHPSPSYLDEAVYGLPELHRPEIRSARLVANPGCYPTASILALAPVAGAIEPDVIIDGKSGISGAGRTQVLDVNHYAEINESCRAYEVEGHRHQPEIVQELNQLRAASAASEPLQVTFVPHLVPMTRGILATCYARFVEPLDPLELLDRYRAFYAGHPFVRIVEEPPATKHAWGSNYCLICPKIAAQTGRLIVTAALDNLVKGAAGQAIQNLNLMIDCDETLGLEALPIYP